MTLSSPHRYNATVAICTPALETCPRIGQSHVSLHMYALPHAKAHSWFISLSRPLSSPPFFIPYFTRALPRRSQRKARWVIRTLGSPLCHRSDTTVPPTGCVTSKECVPHPPTPPQPNHPPLTSSPRWWWDTPSHGTYSERAEMHSTTTGRVGFKSTHDKIASRCFFKCTVTVRCDTSF